MGVFDWLEAILMADSAAANTDFSGKRAYIVVGVVAAAVSAATAAYIIYSRAQRSTTGVDSVQNLLDRCHDQVRSIEQKLSDLNPGSLTSTAA
jgi:hypothetical protein